MKKVLTIMFLSASLLTYIFYVSVYAAETSISVTQETDLTSSTSATLTNDLPYSVDFKIKPHRGGTTIKIKINNLSEETIKDWKLKWTFNESTQIKRLWGANFTQDDQTVEVTPMRWSKKIAPKTSIMLGFSTHVAITKPLDLSFSMPENVAETDQTVNTITDVTKLVNANSQFAFEIFKQINTVESDKNVFISPFSISTALAMLYQGARGDTKEEIAKTLNYHGIDISELNSEYKYLLNYLKNVDPYITLNTSNSIWYNEGFNVNSAFLNTNNDVFGAEIQSLDFGRADAADTINNWISDATNGMIKQMLTPPLQRPMYLINAIYFKGDWTEPFDPDATYAATFTTESGNSNTVDMMHANGTIEYGKGADYSAIRLPYGEKKVSMYCILPAEDVAIDTFISGLSVAKLNEIKQSFATRNNFRINLPKFKMTYGVKSLVTALKALGMNKAFDGEADFSGIADSISVADVLHKAVIDVNEQGTEAAAATVVAVITAVQQDNFNANRPFVFLIVDETTGLVLFIGKAANLTTE
jgi:serine protease inhibitor